MDSDTTDQWLALELNYTAAHQLVSEYQGSPCLKGEGIDHLLRQAAAKSQCKEMCIVILGWGKFVVIAQAITPTFLMAQLFF